VESLKPGDCIVEILPTASAEADGESTAQDVSTFRLGSEESLSRAGRE